MNQDSKECNAPKMNSILKLSALIILQGPIILQVPDCCFSFLVDLNFARLNKHLQFMTD